MKKTGTFKKVLSFVLSVVMLMSMGSVLSFAQEYAFAYYFANEEMTQLYISGFSGTVPEDGYVVIPDTINDCEVVGIAENSFVSIAGLVGVVVPYSVDYIDVNAFVNCGDVALIYPDEYEELVGSFDSETWYEEHEQDYIISGTTLVGYKGTDTIVAVPYNCTAIADGAFKNNTEITALYIEKELVSIGESAFEGCTSLETVIAGDGAGSIQIGSNAFKGTPWLENFPSNFVVLGTTLVKYKGNESSVSIPNVLTAIADGAFFADETTDNIAFRVKVPVTVELFGGDECFYLYKSITDVYPDIVVYEGSDAEAYCKKMGLKYTLAALPADVDNDGTVTAADARYVLRVSAKLESPVLIEETMEVADVTGDSQLNSSDARLILRISAKLDDYLADELLTMPRTSYEILLAASTALSLAKGYGASYSKYAYQEITASDMNTNSKTYFDKFKSELTSSKKAVTETYAHDSQESKDNLFDITLIDSDKIESYDCIIEDGYYILKITLKDEQVNVDEPDGDTYTEQMFPVVKATHYVKEVKGKYWADNIDDWSMTYRDCTLEMKVNIATRRIANISLDMNYDFEVSGKIMGIKISGSNGNATATRTDVLRYSNFSYYAL